MDKKKYIFNGYLAKQLLQKGNTIIDLEKNYKVPNASVFVFEDTKKLHDDITELTSKEF